jgi:tetratricopeptide (TPR) repeat protein
VWFAGSILLVLVLFVSIPWQRLHAGWFTRRGREAHAEGRFAEAVRHYQRVASSPILAASRAARASLASLALSLGEYAQAITIADKMLEAVPSGPESNVLRSDLYLTLAHAHAWRNDRAKASAALAQAATLGGSDYARRAAVPTAAVLLRKGDARGALAALDHRAPLGGARTYLRSASCAELLRQLALLEAGSMETAEQALDGYPVEDLRVVARGWKELEALVNRLPQGRAASATRTTSEEPQTEEPS